MRTHRLAIFALIGLGALALAGCYDGNSTADTVAPVFLSVNIPELNPEVSISKGADVAVATVTFASKAKSPTGTLSAQDDVILSEWVVTCTRTDGGTMASPQWQNSYTVYVPAGGSAPVTNLRVFPAEYFQQAPLYQLFPQNGGFDKETNKTNIRQRLHIEGFGQTVAGKKISVAFDLNFNFAYLIVPVT